METLYIIFILDQLTYRIFNYDPISNIIYSFFIATYFIKNYFIFSRERRIFVLSFIFFIFLSIRDFDNYVYFASTLITFLSFNHSNFLRNNINNIRIIIFSRYLRITLYISFFLFLVTYLGFTNFGFDNQNIFGEGMDGFTYRIRNSGTYTFNVFRSFFASSNYFGIIIFLTANFFYRFKTEINLNKIIYLINFVMIIIMSFFGDSRIITLLTLLVSIYAINDDLISIVKKVNKYLLFSIYITIPVVAYFIYPKIFPIIRGIIFIPNTIKE